jgi:hypothetical protein
MPGDKHPYIVMKIVHSAIAIMNNAEGIAKNAKILAITSVTSSPFLILRNILFSMLHLLVFCNIKHFIDHFYDYMEHAMILIMHIAVLPVGRFNSGFKPPSIFQPA